jgi:transposase InsO family protein
MSHDFRYFLERHESGNSTTSAGSPEANGMAERTQGIHQRFWTHAAINQPPNLDPSNVRSPTLKKTSLWLGRYLTRTVLCMMLLPKTLQFYKTKMATSKATQVSRYRPLLPRQFGNRTM